ncbi:MAG: ABC transporter ATP-binding protein [Parachlamydia sp.]|nr:ABC transporter ATP-binding protein [Parachlamydia sp.]
MLKAENLSCSIGLRHLLEDISHTFHPGSLSAILGPNGAGKTSFLKALCGLLSAKGRVLWQQQNLFELNRLSISKILTLVPQNPNTVFDYSVEEFVAMGRYAHGNSKNIDQSLEAVDGLRFKKRPLQQLSQGERQRIYIARALATEAPVILLDEPAAHLDIRHQMDIWTLLTQLSSQGKTILIATHDLDQAQRYCHEALLLFEGKCVAAGMPYRVITPQNLHAYFGMALPEAPAHLSEAERMRRNKCSVPTRGDILPSRVNIKIK